MTSQDKAQSYLSGGNNSLSIRGRRMWSNIMTVLLIGLIISLCRRTHEIASCGTFHVDFNAYVGAVYVLSGNVLYSSVY